MDKISVIEKPLAVAPGTLLRLTEKQAACRFGMIEPASGRGMFRAMQALQFKVGEVVKFVSNEAPPSRASAKKNAAEKAPEKQTADAKQADA